MAQRTQVPPLDEYFVAVTANTEYYIAFRRCVAVRLRGEQRWDKEHRTLGKRLKGCVFGKNSEHVIQDPMIGVSLWFKTTDGTDLLTSRVEALRRPTANETDFCLDSRYWSPRTTTTSGVKRDAAQSLEEASDPAFAGEPPSTSAPGRATFTTQEMRASEIAAAVAQAEQRLPSAPPQSETGLPGEEDVESWLGRLFGSDEEDEGLHQAHEGDDSDEGPLKTQMADKFFLEKG